MDEQIIIRRSKKKAAMILLAGVLPLVAGYLLFVYANDEVFGWILLITAALFFLLGISNLRDRKPQIILTGKGITEPYSIREEIEWDAVLQVDDFFFRGQDFVRMLLPEKYKDGLIRPGWFWRLDPIYAQQGLKAVYIRVSGLEINSRMLAGLIHDIVKTAPEERAAYLQKVKESM